MAFYDDLSLLTVTLHFDETAIDSSAFLVREPETGEDVASTNIPSIVCAKIGYTLTGWKRTATEFAGKSQDGEFAVEDVASAFSVFGEWDWDEETEDEVWGVMWLSRS